MNTNRDRLDDAIDDVVTRMVHVTENDALATQIIHALPERVSWFGWLFHSWAPRLAMIAIVVVAGIVWGNRTPPPTPQLDPLASTRTVPQPVVLVASVREAEPNRTMPLERVAPLERMERLISAADFDRSLPAIGAVASLDFDSLAPASLPASEGLVLESLVIADLPLTAEPISPR
jgi:hypothetical protein